MQELNRAVEGLACLIDIELDLSQALPGISNKYPSSHKESSHDNKTLSTINMSTPNPKG